MERAQKTTQPAGDTDRASLRALAVSRKVHVDITEPTDEAGRSLHVVFWGAHPKGVPAIPGDAPSRRVFHELLALAAAALPPDGCAGLDGRTFEPILVTTADGRGDEVRMSVRAVFASAEDLKAWRKRLRDRLRGLVANEARTALGDVTGS